VKLAWTHGGEAEVVSLSDHAVKLISSVPSPPGSRIEGASGEVRLKVKIHASRKREDGRFDLEGRPIDMTREVREAINARIGS